MNQERKPSYDAIAQAQFQPNGWVYEVEGNFGPHDDVPPEAIAGAWQVDATGHIVGSFIWNPRHAKAPQGLGIAEATVQFPFAGH